MIIRILEFVETKSHNGNYIRQKKFNQQNLPGSKDFFQQTKYRKICLYLHRNLLIK